MISLAMEVGLSPGDFVLDGDAAPSPQKGGGAPQFSTHVYCCQMAGWIKMPSGMEVGLGPDEIVRWGPSSPAQKRTQRPVFGTCLLWPNGCIIRIPLGKEVGLSLGDSVRWGPSSPPLKGHSPQFSANVRCG